VAPDSSFTKLIRVFIDWVSFLKCPVEENAFKL
jgi:hypothetical protein